jgi:hypothetical protein
VYLLRRLQALCAAVALAAIAMAIAGLGAGAMLLGMVAAMLFGFTKQWACVGVTA